MGNETVLAGATLFKVLKTSTSFRAFLSFPVVLPISTIEAFPLADFDGYCTKQYSDNSLFNSLILVSCGPLEDGSLIKIATFAHCFLATALPTSSASIHPFTFPLV